MFLFKYTGPKVFTKIGGEKYYKRRWFKEQLEDGTYTRELSFFINNRISMVTKDIELKGISGEMKVKYVGHNGNSVPAIAIKGTKFKRDEWVILPTDFDSIDHNGNDLFLTMGFKMRFDKAVKDNINDCEEDAKILILRKFGGLGDILMQSIMFPDLKRQYPNMDVTYAIPKQFLPLFDNCSDIDHVIDKDEVETQIYRLIADGEYELISDVSQCCVIHEVNSLKDKGIVDKQRPDIWANHFGLNLKWHDTCIRITERETDFAKKYLKRDERKIIGFAPFSAARSRSYPFVQEVIDKLTTLNYRVLLIHSDDTPYVNCEKITHQDLRTLGAIINELDLLIGVDSGPLHYAGILKKKVVGIYGVTDYNSRLKYYDAVGIQGKCQSNRKPCWHMQSSFCMKDNIAGCMYIAPERVINVVDQLLMEIPKSSVITKCRACDSPNLSEYLDLGLMPLVNQLEATKEKALAVDRFPLEVLFCNNCGLSQLSYVVDPALMFGNYPYRSGISQTFVKHCDFLADYYYKTFNLKDTDYVMDIASNDGTLLKSFKAKGLNVLGIEPASNLAQIANDEQIETIGSFWNEILAENIKTNYGEMKLIFGTNIFAHVHDVVGFLKSAKKCLAEDGRIVLEFPYLMNLIRGNAFDTIYHEHLSYFTVKPLQILAEKCGLIISDIIEDSVHCGSIRIEFALQKDRKYQGNRIKLFQGVEKIDGYGDFAFYKKWGDHRNDLIVDIKEKLHSLKAEGHSIAAFGAAAKGNVLLNAIGADSNLINYIVDDTPEKIGKFAPVTGIPIVDRRELVDNPTDYLLILPWNFKDEIIDNTSFFYKGKYIVALPEFEVIEKQTDLKIIVVVMIYNRLENLKLWINCWKKCQQLGAELRVIHNYDKGINISEYKKYCQDNDVQYIPRLNVGMDIGAFQDVCRNRLKDFDNNWDVIFWVTDDVIPMRKDFLLPFVSEVLKPCIGIACMQISDLIAHHARTSGICIQKATANKLTFPVDPIKTKDDCYEFEHRGKENMMKQIEAMGLKIAMPLSLDKSAVWDMNHTEFDRWQEHRSAFTERNSKVFIGSYTNVVKDYCDKKFYENLHKLSKGNEVHIVDNSIGLRYFDHIKSLCKDYENFHFKHIMVPLIPKESVFQRRVIESANYLRQLFLDSGCEYFITIESDILPPIDVIESFKASIKKLPDNWGMLGAMYHGQHGGKGFHDLGKEVKGLYQPKQVLCGCTIYNRKLVEKYPFRWDKNDLRHFHDYWMVQDAQKEFSFWDDRDIDCEHFPSNAIRDKDIR